MSIRIDRLDHLVLTVASIDKTCEFYSRVLGMEFVRKIIEVNQSPIGRTPRSNPATYTGIFTPIRDFYSLLPEAKERGYKPGRFSFNVPGGRCEA